MKLLLLTSALLCLNLSFSQNNYQIHINGETHDISLEKEFEVKIGKDMVKMMIASKDTLTYQDDMVRFNYPKEFQVQSVTIDAGIEQLMLMTADGSGFIIQKYKTIDPSMLNEMMMNEVTKESINYGFQLERKDYDRTLTGNTSIKVNKAVLTYKDETNTYEIASFGKKDQGLMLMSMKMYESGLTVGDNLISMIWDSLEILD